MSSDLGPRGLEHTSPYVPFKRHFPTRTSGPEFPVNIVREANQDPVTRLAALLQRVYTEGWRDGRGGAERASTNWAADAEAFLDSLTTR